MLLFSENMVIISELQDDARISLQAHYGDLDGRVVGDLGCGCGTLTIGAAVMDSALVIGFEIDGDALEVFRTNVGEQELNNVEVVQCNIQKIPAR